MFSYIPNVSFYADVLKLVDGRRQENSNLLIKLEVSCFVSGSSLMDKWDLLRYEDGKKYCLNINNFPNNFYKYSFNN